MKKKLLAAMMTVTLCVGALAGCGNGGGSGNGGASGSGGGAGTENGGQAADEPVTDLKMLMVSVGFNLEDAEAVEAEINAYIEPKINANVDIEWLDMGEYANQMNLKITSGEEIDIMPTFGTLISSLYGQGALTDLTELVEEYGKDIVDSVGADYMKAGEVNGKLYSIPIVQSFATEDSFLYRTDIVEKYNIDLSSVKKLEDLTPILKQVHEAEPGLTLIVANSINESMLREWAWDGLGDENGVLMDAMNSATVSNLYESEEYKNYVNLMHEWYEAGYIQTDAATTSENLTTLFDTGTAFATIAKNYPGNVEDKFSRCAYSFDAIPLADPAATTNQVANSVMTIPTTSENPEKAMEFLNLLYSDAVLQNLMCYGIEGQDYRIVDEEKGIVDYLEGEDMMTCKYVNKFMIGNSLIAYTAATAPEGIHEQLEEYNKSARKSVALGFSYDSSNVTNELAALGTVTAKYRRGLESGSLDPETELPKFIEELNSAGIDTVVEEKQKQLDEWLGK